ncbi:MAG: DUF3426 domain-containing protein [Gammaproteobacteria bacterium]
MFTRCPECGTVFRVTANQLRVAQGDVRCGNCAHVFNAMQYLTDELPENEADAETEQTSTEESATPDIQPQDKGLESFEFDAPEQTWSEFFIEARTVAGDIALDGELEAITANPEEWQSMLSEIGVNEKDSTRPGEAANDSSSQQEESESSAVEAVDDGPTGEYPKPVHVEDSWKRDAGNDLPSDGGTTDLPDTDTNEVDAWDSKIGHEEIVLSTFVPETAAETNLPPWTDLEAEVEAEEEEKEPTPRHRLRWASLAVILCATLGAQLMHYSRDSLAADPRYGEKVRNFYARLDTRLYPEWALSAFSVRRSEALAGGTAPNALDIKAAVEVGGAHPVGLPLLRVTLRDQWANIVGSRVFVPAEYLAAELPPIVPPGTRIPVVLSLADPGTAARGYEVDLCLPRRQSGLECQRAERPLQP